MFIHLIVVVFFLSFSSLLHFLILFATRDVLAYRCSSPAYLWRVPQLLFFLKTHPADDLDLIQVAKSTAFFLRQR